MVRVTGRQLMADVLLASWCLAVAGVARAEGASYLIICPEAYAELVQPLADWKTRKGVPATVVTTAEAGFSTYEIVQYVTEAYLTWDPRPQYVLIAADFDEIPMDYQGPASGYTDTVYGSVDDDFFVELHVGRFPAQNADELESMVARTLAYERDAASGDEAFFSGALLLVHEDGDDDDWVHYYGDAFWTAELMAADGLDQVSIVSYDDTPSAPQAAEEILDGGVSYVTYHGVIGGTLYCEWPGFSIEPEDLDAGPLLPVVASYTCQTMAAGDDCLGERWVRAGDAGRPRGAVAFVGQADSCSSCAHWRSALRRGFWSYVFEQGETTDIRRLGEAVEAGRMRYYDEFHSSGQYLASNLYGDPELNLWTGPPRDLQLSHPPQLPGAQVEVLVRATVAGQPQPGVVVCAAPDDGAGSDGAYAVGTTDERGEALLSFDPKGEQVMAFTATGRDLLPYEGRAGVAGYVVEETDDENSTGGDEQSGPADDDDCSCDVVAAPRESTVGLVAALLVAAVVSRRSRGLRGDRPRRRS